jgi:hypothetical protein
MGQQQLLLLVLSTVIVGLATVAGIQAFSENQAQATQDALTQKGLSISNDIAGLAAKPPQLGGVDTSSADSDLASEIATKAGYDGTVIPVEGASGNSDCEIQSDDIQVVCSSDTAPQDVTITLRPDTTVTSFSDNEPNSIDGS